MKLGTARRRMHLVIIVLFCVVFTSPWAAVQASHSPGHQDGVKKDKKDKEDDKEDEEKKDKKDKEDEEKEDKKQSDGAGQPENGGRSSQGTGDDSALPGDALPAPEVRLVEPLPSGPDPVVSGEQNIESPPMIEVEDDEAQRIRLHVSPAGDVLRVTGRIGRKIFEFSSEADESTYVGLLPPLEGTREHPFTITADFGSTTSSVKGVLRPRVAGASGTSLAEDPLVLTINRLHRLVFARVPTFAEWEYWALRTLRGEKSSAPDLYGAMQWQERFGQRSQSKQRP